MAAEMLQPMPTPAAPRSYDCDSCGATIPPEALTGGAARIVSGRMLCAACRERKRPALAVPALVAALAALAGGQAALWARGGGARAPAADPGADRRIARIEERIADTEQGFVAIADLASALQVRLAQIEAAQTAAAASVREQLTALLEAQRALNEELGALARYLPVRGVGVPETGPDEPPVTPPEVPAEDPRESPRARWILDRLGSDNPRVRAHALRDVPGLPSNAALLPEVLARFEDEYGFVRQAAYEVAEAIGDPRAASGLIARARVEKLPVERLLALRALGAIRREPIDWPALTEDEIEAVLARWSGP